MVSLRRLTRSEDGQDLMEYGLLVSLIAIAALVGVRLVATQISDVMWGLIAAIDF
jgi:Flp pilus assembly pilin Flp